MLRYVAVPGRGTARWLLPVGRPEIGGVLESWAPFRLASRAAWTAVRAASHIGRVADIPGVSVLEVEGVRGTDWSALGWRWREPPVAVIYLGTPGPRRKAVVHLVERETEQCRAVVKVPLTDWAKAAVLHEADVLEALAAEGYEPAPRMLHADRARGITTQTFVEGHSASRRLGPDVWRLLRSLMLPGENTSLAAEAEAWRRELGSGANLGVPSRVAARVIDELTDSAPLPACWEHGDFTPWNIKRLSNGGCVLLDWENARRRGLPLLDAFHFLHMQDFLFEGRPKLHAVEIMAAAVEMGMAPAQCLKLEAAYLVGAYVKSRQQENAERARIACAALELYRRKAA